MSITLSGTSGITTPAENVAGQITVGAPGIKFSDNSVQTVATVNYTAPTPVVYLYAGSRTTSLSTTWTKPTGNYTTAKIELWGGGAGGQGSKGGGAGGYTSLVVPLVDLPDTLAINVPSNGGSYNNGNGVSVSIAGVTNATAGGGSNAPAGGSGLIVGGGAGGACGNGIFGGASVGATGGSGNSPGGGGGTNGGAGGTYGGNAQIQITVW